MSPRRTPRAGAARPAVAPKRRKAAPKGRRRTPAAGSVAVDLALQGGGAHGAFTWGVLDRLLEEPSLAFDGISGTSAGAMNAVVMADGLMRNGPAGARAALTAFWQRVSEAGRMSPLQRGWIEMLATTAPNPTRLATLSTGSTDALAPASTLARLAAARTAAACAAEWHRHRNRHGVAAARVARLTAREREVFDLLLAGKLNKQMAALLDSQEATIKVHRSRLMRKLEVRSLADLLKLGQLLDEPVGVRAAATTAAEPGRIRPAPTRGLAAPAP
ncbi:MAG: patatin-like phospholipase family protein [Proteobacteria bacterium]|nr:patatin-like phospholipase family protein [Pseudomonadota bacterium]